MLSASVIVLPSLLRKTSPTAKSSKNRPRHDFGAASSTTFGASPIGSLTRSPSRRTAGTRAKLFHHSRCAHSSLLPRALHLSQRRHGGSRDARVRSCPPGRGQLGSRPRGTTAKVSR